MELEIIKFVQSFANPVADAVFVLLTMSGEKYFLAAIVAYVYWNIDRERGRFMGFGLLFTLMFGNGVKDFFKVPRMTEDMGVRILRAKTATSFSFPSGHTLGASAAAASYAVAADDSGRRRRGFNIGLVLMFVPGIVVGLSRLYLGAHYPRDVVAGIILGVGLPLALHEIYKKIWAHTKFFALGFIVLSPLFFWAVSDDFYKVSGCFAGFVLGALFEERFVSFKINPRMSVKIFRYFSGLALVLGIYIVTKLFLPVAPVWHFARYASVLFFAIGVWPLCFSAIDRKFR